jgi:hypothetical protein
MPKVCRYYSGGFRRQCPTTPSPTHSPGRQPPAGSQEAYGGVRLAAMPGGGRIVNDLAAAAGAADGGRRRTHGSWVRVVVSSLVIRRTPSLTLLLPTLPPSLTPSIRRLPIPLHDRKPSCKKPRWCATPATYARTLYDLSLLPPNHQGKRNAAAAVAAAAPVEGGSTSPSGLMLTCRARWQCTG